MKEATKKLANFELLRIISMAMIVILHFLGFGGILNKVQIGEPKYYLANIIEYACIIAVNLYVMITGYFCINKKIRFPKILNLEMQMIFYLVVIYVCSVMFGNENFEISKFVKNFFPYITKQYWFLTAYISLYVMIPIVNKVVSNIGKREYKSFLIILLSILSLATTLYPKNSILNLSSGYSIGWFIVLYLVGGYIKLYFSEHKFNSYMLIGIYIGMITIHMGIDWLSFKFPKFELLGDYRGNSLNYNNVITLIEAIAVFLFFKQLKIKNTYMQKIILTISPLTLGVYLIHENPIIRGLLWKQWLKPHIYLDSWKVFAVLVIDVFLIFIVSCMIDKIRMLLFKFFRVENIINKIWDILNKIRSKYITSGDITKVFNSSKSKL